MLTESLLQKEHLKCFSATIYIFASLMTQFYSYSVHRMSGRGGGGAASIPFVSLCEYVKPTQQNLLTLALYLLP